MTEEIENRNFSELYEELTILKVSLIHIGDEDKTARILNATIFPDPETFSVKTWLDVYGMLKAYLGLIERYLRQNGVSSGELEKYAKKYEQRLQRWSDPLQFGV